MPRILFTLRLLTALGTVFVILLLCMQCIDIYLDGNAPEKLEVDGVHMTSVFRMDDVAARLQKLAVPLLGYALLVAVTVVMQHVGANVPSGISAAISPENRLRLMKTRISELPETALLEEKKRRWILSVSFVFISVCVIGALSYLLNGDYFISWDLELVMGKMIKSISTWIISAFVAACIASMICKRSILREIVVLQEQDLSIQTKKPIVKTHAVRNARVCIFLLAIMFIVLGVMNGGLYDVLVKAINICTECIGLG